MALLLPKLQLPLLAAAVLLSIYPLFRVNLLHRRFDRNATRAMLALGALPHLDEALTASTLAGFEGYSSVERLFRRTGTLQLPDYGWRSRMLANALKLTLKTGQVRILSLALEQMIAHEAFENERQGLLAGEKYTLIASSVVAAAVLAVVNTWAPSEFMLPYVLAQSLLASLWLYLMSGEWLEGLSILPPTALLVFLAVSRFL
ncbi:MAG TPA: hypothetical protein ENN60_03210 [archaeon]|nr:hypothetical protein [archaeon]